MIATDHLQSMVRLGRKASRYWWLAVAALAVGAVTTIAVAQLRPRHYRSEAVVYYQEGIQWTQAEGGGVRRIGLRLKDMLLARARLATLIGEFGLYPELVKAGRLPEAIEEARLATSFRIADGDVFAISFTGDSPVQAQRVTARLTELLIEENAQLRASQAEVARAFLDAEKKRNESELSAKEAALLGFLAKHPEFAQEPTATIGAALRASPRKAPESAASADKGVLATLRREEERLKRQLAAPGPIPQAPIDPALAAARSQAEAALQAAQRELADRRARFTEEHPDVRSAAAMVKQAKDAYDRAAAAAAVAQPTVTPGELEARLVQVRRDIAEHRRKHPEDRGARLDPGDGSRAAQRIVAVEAEWQRLTREVGEARERLQTLDARQFVASMTATTVVSGQAAQIIVIDPAFLPAKPIGMSKTRLLLMGFLMTLLASAGATALAALVDDRISDRVDAERLELAPVLVEMPSEAMAQLAGIRAHEQPGAGGPADGGAGATSEATGAAPHAATRIRAHEALPEAVRELPDGEEPSLPGEIPALAAETAPRSADAWGASGEERSTPRQPSTAVQLIPLANPGGALTVLESQAVRASEGGKLPEIVQVQRVELTRTIGPALLMLGAPDSQAAAAFRVLRHRLESDRDARTILVTSPRTGEGKTLCAMNLALALAEEGRARVMLLEANCRAPALARLLEFQPPICIREQLELHRERPTLPWVVVETVSPWLHTMAVAPAEDGRPFLDGPALATCIEDLRRAGYDHVVVDGPSILGSADVNLLEECVDGILVTLRARESRARDLRKAVDQIGGAKVVGIALFGT